MEQTTTKQSRLNIQGGAILLADACQRVAIASSTLAIAEMIVDAKDEVAASFYQHFRFISLPGQALRLLLPATVFCH